MCNKLQRLVAFRIPYTQCLADLPVQPGIPMPAEARRP